MANKITKIDELNIQHDLHVADFEAKNEISQPTFLTVLGQGMTVVQHFADKRKPISVQLQLKSGGCLEWISSSKEKTSIRIADINFIIFGRAGTKPRQVNDLLAKFEHQLVHENRMLGIVTEDKCYDFEAISKEERDALCTGLALIACKT